MSPDAMKSEALYDHIVMCQLIDDFIDGIEWDMQRTPTSDSYFNQLSVQKFALEMLLEDICEHKGEPPEIIVGRFVERMASSAKDTDDVEFVFSISRDAAQSILDGLYYD